MDGLLLLFGVFGYSIFAASGQANEGNYTPHLSIWQRSEASGPEGARTLGLYSAIVALSQLSYRPNSKREF